MATVCNPSLLANEARCYEKCIPPGMQLAVANYLLSQLYLANSPMANIDPSYLANQARCYEKCIPSGMQLPVAIYLLCQLTGGGGGGALALQVFEGAGDPVGLQPGQDATKAAIYINTDNGVTVGWNVGTASWML